MAVLMRKWRQLTWLQEFQNKGYKWHTQKGSVFQFFFKKTSYQSEVNLYLGTLIGRLCKYYFRGSEPSMKFLEATQPLKP